MTNLPRSLGASADPSDRDRALTHVLRQWQALDKEKHEALLTVRYAMDDLAANLEMGRKLRDELAALMASEPA